MCTLQNEYGSSGATGANADNLIDMLVLLLCNHADGGAVSARLYPHIQLLTDLIAPFFDGGPYSFSLVQFCVAFQFLQEKLVTRRGLKENESLAMLALRRATLDVDGESYDA